MRYSYLIQIRFLGDIKNEIKKRIHDINNQYELPQKRAVPHVTNVGPFYCKDEKKLLNIFTNSCKQTNIMEIKIRGYGSFDENNVLFIKIYPNSNLKDFESN